MQTPALDVSNATIGVPFRFFLPPFRCITRASCSPGFVCCRFARLSEVSCTLGSDNGLHFVTRVFNTDNDAKFFSGVEKVEHKRSGHSHPQARVFSLLVYQRTNQREREHTSSR